MPVFFINFFLYSEMSIHKKKRRKKKNFTRQDNNHSFDLNSWNNWIFIIKILNNTLKKKMDNNN
jgi:hypothetical protein